MKELRAGLIGCGNLGKTHTDCLSRLDGMNMVAYCDVLEEKAKSLLDRYGGSYVTSDADKLLNDDSLDAVYICTLNNTHREYCIKAASAGLSILVEKPLANTVEECTEICDAVEKHGSRLMTGFKMRFYDMVLKAKELIPEPIIAVVQGMDNRWAEGHWGNDPVKGGGNIVSQGCHSTDIMRFLTGADPYEVYAAGGNYYQPSGVVDNACMVYKFENRAVGSLTQGDSASCPYTSKFFIQLFSDGKSATLSDRLCTLTYYENGKEAQVFKGQESGFIEENMEFISSIREGRKPRINHIDGLIATAMVQRGISSVYSGKVEAINL